MENQERSTRFKRITVEFPRDVAEMIEVAARSRHLNKSQLIRDAVRQYLLR